MKSVGSSGSCRASPTPTLSLSWSIFLTDPLLLENPCPAAVRALGGPFDNSIANGFYEIHFTDEEAEAERRKDIPEAMCLVVGGPSQGP